MLQAIFGGILLKYLGLFIRWVALCIIDFLRGRKLKSFKAIKNKYTDITADSLAYDFGNKLIGIAFLMAVILAIFQAEKLF